MDNVESILEYVEAMEATAYAEVMATIEAVVIETVRRQS